MSPKKNLAKPVSAPCSISAPAASWLGSHLAAARLQRVDFSLATQAMQGRRVADYVLASFVLSPKDEPALA